MTEAGVSTVVLKTDKLTIVEWSFKPYYDVLEYKRIYSKIFSLGSEKYFLVIDTLDVSLDCISLGVRSYIMTSDEPCVSCTLGVKKPNGSVIQSFDGQLTYDKIAWKCEDRQFAIKSKLLQSMDVEAPEEIVTFFCILCHKDSVFATSRTSMQTPPSQALVTQCPVEAASSSSKAIGTLLQNFKDLFVSQSHGDIKILVDDREFKAHTCVLIARSKVFASMLEHNMAEKNSGVINITDCKPEIFEAFLLFLYSGELNHVTPANAVDLYNVSEKYNMDEMKEACIQCLASNLSVDSICDVIRLAVVHNESELLRNATEFFIVNVEAILITEKWKDFLMENHLVANELLIKMAKSNKTKK